MGQHGRFPGLRRNANADYAGTGSRSRATGNPRSAKCHRWGNSHDGLGPLVSTSQRTLLTTNEYHTTITPLVPPNSLGSWLSASGSFSHCVSFTRYLN